MKNFILILLSLCLLSTASLGENAITAANSQKLVFKAQPNAFDDYNGVFVAFDKGASIMQSYEKLAKMHAVKPAKKGFAAKNLASENAKIGENVPDKSVENKGFASENPTENDFDGCACDGLVAKIEPYKDFHYNKSVYIWDEKRLIIKRECWGAGFFYFELKSVDGGTKITAKFSKNAS